MIDSTVLFFAIGAAAVAVTKAVQVIRHDPKKPPKMKEIDVLRKENLALHLQIISGERGGAPDFTIEDQLKYEGVFEAVRSAILVYDYSKGRVSAEHTIAVLKATLIKYRADYLNLGLEDKERLEKHINDHIASMNARGFKTN